MDLALGKRRKGRRNARTWGRGPARPDTHGCSSVGHIDVWCLKAKENRLYIFTDNDALAGVAS